MNIKRFQPSPNPGIITYEDTIHFFKLVDSDPVQINRIYLGVVEVSFALHLAY